MVEVLHNKEDNKMRKMFSANLKRAVSMLLAVAMILGAFPRFEASTAAAAANITVTPGQGYGTLKNRVADCVIAALEPMQAEYKRLIADKAYLQSVLDENAKTASYLANKTLRKVQKKVGFAARG